MILCDINLPGEISGIDFIWQTRQIRAVPVIYLTAYCDQETFNQAKQTQPSAYLNKPYQLTLLRNAIELAFHQFSFQRSLDKQELNSLTEEKTLNRDNILLIEDYIFMKQEYNFVKVSLNNILFIEADGNYLHIQTTTRRYLLRMSLGSFLEKTNSHNLVKVNRSFAVNLLNVDSFREQEITLGKYIVTLSTLYKEEFLNRFRIR